MSYMRYNTSVVLAVDSLSSSSTRKSAMATFVLPNAFTGSIMNWPMPDSEMP